MNVSSISIFNLNPSEKDIRAHYEHFSARLLEWENFSAATPTAEIKG